MRSCGGGWDVESGAGPEGKHVQEWMGRALSGHPAIQGADGPSGVPHPRLSPISSAALPSPILRPLTIAVGSSECRAVPRGTLPESLFSEPWVEDLHLLRRIQPSPQRATWSASVPDRVGKGELQALYPHDSALNWGCSSALATRASLSPPFFFVLSENTQCCCLKKVS